MPRIDDPVAPAKFKKKSYRPWGEDLFGETPITADETQNKNVQSKENYVTIEASALIEKKLDTETHTYNENPSKELEGNWGAEKGSIGGQLEGALGGNNGAIRKQMGNGQNHDKGAIGEQLESDLGSKKGAKSKNSTVGFEALIDSVLVLTGHQRKILFFIVDDCISAGELTTGQISNETLRTLLNTDSDTIKSAIKRLIKKGLITRKGGKRGRGGFARYTVTDFIRKTVMQEKKKASIGKQLGGDLGSNWGTDRGANDSSSSSNVLKTTTTSESIIPDEWITVDIQPLKEINFTLTHLRQIIAQQKLSPEIVQTSINAFAFDLKENAKAKKITQDPLSFFVGILRKGNPYIPPSNYESIEDKAMRLYYEKIKELEKVRSEREKEIVEYEFVAWSEKTPEQEKKKIAPSYPIGSTGFIATLKEFFCKDIWPKRKKELFENDQTTKLEVTSV
jgi:predicted transcriptional regulator